MLMRPEIWETRTALLSYLAGKMDTTPSRLVGSMPYEILAIVRNGVLKGAVLYTNNRQYSIEMAWAGEPGWLTPGTLKDIFRYPFEQLGVLVAIGIVPEEHQKAADLLTRIGATLSGKVPHTFGLNKHGLVFCMGYDSCTWLQDRTTKTLERCNG